MYYDINNDTFVPISGYDGYYEINKKGIIRNIKTGHIKSYYIAKVGYYMIDLYKDNQNKKFYLHRLLAEHFIPNPNKKPQVNHKDGNKLNNSLDNLEWVTGKENMQHAYRTGLSKGNPKLCDKILTSLFLNRFLKGETITSIANDTKVNLKLSALSVQFKRIARKLNKEEEYKRELKTQKTKRAKLKGLKSRKRKILFVYDKNKNLVGIFGSLTQASEVLNIRRGGIANVLAGRTKTVSGYYIKQLNKLVEKEQ